MSVSVFDFVRWLQARGVTDERLAAYRECVEAILRQADGDPVDPEHIEAARWALEEAGKAQTVAHLKDAADALRRFQGGPAAQVSASPADPAVRKSHLTSLLIALAITVAGSAAVVVGPRLWPQPTASGFDAPAKPSPEEADIRRAAAPPPGNNVAQSADRADASPDGGVEGEATLLFDDEAERYEVKTDATSATRMAEPKTATIQFSSSAPEHSRARRILLMIDATQTGKHVADGEAIHDMMFENKPVVVGEMKAKARAAVLQWIDDDGQIYPPQIGTRCEITVLSAYTGEPDGEFRAEVPRCVVRSIGANHTLSAVKLRLKGRVDR
jgi:hypothetical protein